MKTLAGLFFAAASVFAGMPDASVRVELQVIQIPEAQALDLIPRLSRMESATAAFRDLQTLCDAGKASRAAILMATGFSGSETSANSREEVRYVSEAKDPDPRLFPSASVLGGLALCVPYPAIEFAERDAGVRLDFRLLRLVGERGVELALTTEHVLLEKRERVETGVRATGTRTYVETPVFLVRGVTAPVTLAERVPNLVGVFRLPEQKGTFELHVVTATSMRTAGSPAEINGDTNGVSLRRLEIQRFRVPMIDGLNLRAQAMTPETAEAAFAALLRMAKEGRAELCEWTSLPVSGGSESTCRNEREIWRAVENFHAVFPGRWEPMEEYSKYPIEFSLQFDPPLAYEIRTVGDSLQTGEMSRARGQAIGLTVGKIFYDIDGYFRQAVGPNFKGQHALVYHPLFKKRATASWGELMPGKRQLHSFHNLTSEGRSELTFIQLIEEPLPRQTLHAK